ncbi:hypothetical protein TL16_g10501 [Triparma laevis f. inornata]|uniref:Uncharacterized protein n=1 Tax=Triparma laevis f. inornata TaxID=1714386 RepID=A0A9W7EPR6_9STRA|nr:hypothetical protein TL16_g10501 [Triparma laevis f. inornata]
MPTHSLSPNNKSPTSTLTFHFHHGLPQRGLFGLGGPEVAIIAVAAAFLLGPSKLAEFSKDLGKVAGELKEVPKEVRRSNEIVCALVAAFHQY